MRAIDQWLDEYGDSHRHPTNKAIHWICVPLIFFTAVGFLWAIPFPGSFSISGVPLNWAIIAMTLVFLYYITLSFSLAVGLLLFGTSCLLGWYYLEPLVPSVALTSLVIFILAWIGQFYGHKVEGKKPSFFKDLQFLMIGPAWLMHFIFKKAGIPY